MYIAHVQERRQKNFQGGATKNKTEKIALLCLSQGSNEKKDRKIALFSLYLLNLYHV